MGEDLLERLRAATGLAAAAKKALSFAILGALALRGGPNTLARCTVASRTVVAGTVWRP